MFPNANHMPTSLMKESVCFGIAFSCATHLLRPEARIGDGDGVVDGAAVPEAPVHEDRHSRSGEDEIRGSTNSLERTVGDSVPEPRRVDGATESKFWLRVPPLV